MYYFFKKRLEEYPFPEEFNEQSEEDVHPPVVKPIIFNTQLDELYRWGMKYRSTGNHRILYTVHNYKEVVLLHYFDKQYNGNIVREDIVPAEKTYEPYCFLHPPY
ncbi:hypothetical protein [Jeotgalibacillus salarius]|uniref:Uncharacterized protein n=1 Tax=Jeotgalibacillus salarius TaxID=546023 RepID=A0A4Y8LED8_9BACL|nr:hypothetical protein [Jeotgalibacillus salarius]TFD99420.1 hypothetical protein E2626_14260 [Jeotgalibacillus salarius]